MDNQIKTAAELEAELRKMRQEFQELTKSLGWARLLKYAEVQMQTRLQTMKAPAAEDKGTLLKEYVCGEYAGIELFTKIPDIALQQGEQQLKEMAKSMTEENVDED